MAIRLKLTPLAALLLAVSAAGAAGSGIALYQARDYNKRLVDATVQTTQAADALFAEAWRLSGNGQVQQSLELYMRAMAQGDAPLRMRASYNAGNIYLRQAIELLETEGYAAWERVTPLLAMARERYVKALQVDPGWMEAKYNLELVLRLQPVFDGVKVPDREEQEAEPSERLGGWESIPGFPRGMP